MSIVDQVGKIDRSLQESRHKLRKAIEQPKGPAVPDAHIGWEGPVYLPPKGPNKEEFAQCATCIHFLLKTGLCYLMGPKDKINGGMSCNFYAPGTPRTQGEPSGSLTPKETGLVDRPVQCRHCRFFDTKTEPKVHCDLFTQLNRAFPHVFKLDRYVDPYGCCDFNSEGKRSPRVFAPRGPFGEQKEPT